MVANKTLTTIMGSLVVMLAGTGAARADTPVPPAIGSGALQSVSIFPAKVVLRGAGAVQQLVVTGHYANGGVRDVTAHAKFRAGDAKALQVESNGLLVAMGNGVAEVTAEIDGKTVRSSVTVEGTEGERPVNFANEIVPIFSKLGCNAGGCHGKASGQNGFKLSLLGFEPRIDYDALTREARGRRVFPAAPAASLLLLKATGAVAHGGGKRLDPASRDYQTFLGWVRAGMPFGLASDPHVVRIEVTPARRLVARQAGQQLAVTAHYSDGSQRDVTHQAEYSANETEIASVTPRGFVETLQTPGEAAVMVRFLGRVTVFRVTVPLNGSIINFPQHAAGNFIDQFVFAKLKQLGVPPAELCTDGEFLRRTSIDITGTLPTAAEAEQFLADPDPKKREKLVDDLLSRPAYASYFALKWGDILRNRRNGLVNVGGGQARTAALHGWIRSGLAENKPYDRLVRELVTARGDFFGDGAQPGVAWYNVLRTPQALVDDTAQVFLGTRLQCAQCHHHPYDKWSQDDYWGLAAFFARVQLVDARNGPKAGGKAPKTLLLAREGKVAGPNGKTYIRPRPLDGPELTVPPEADPRAKLADWLTAPENPFFARALVNRYWAHFFGRGIVEPLDDMRVSNPPSNPELLDALAKDFVAHQYDLKHLIRTLCTSTTYQLSSVPNADNQKDKQNFARYYPRRLPAEVLLDALDQVTAVPTKFNGIATPTRAIDLPDEAVQSPTLEVFGKPERASACECERVGAATLAQSLHMLGSAEIHGKLKPATSRAGLLANDKREPADKIKDIFLWVYARPPTAAELKTAEVFLQREQAGAPATGPGRQWAYEDLIWALLNTKEFLFNH